jgi:hypothetical protein
MRSDDLARAPELARRLEVHERVVRHMLDPEHASKPARIQAALVALGKQMKSATRLDAI